MTDASTCVAELRKLIADFIAARDWQRYHDAKNLAMSVAIEAGELMEHFQWTRNDELAALLAQPDERDKIADELADIACYLLSLANVLDIDLSAAVQAKVAKNCDKYPVGRFRGQYFRPGG
jgi:NTP pyrophosphatase (non-canonical NTP hydrolase)